MIRPFVMVGFVAVLLLVMMPYFVRISVGVCMAKLAVHEMNVELNTLDTAANLSRKVEVKFATEAELGQLSLNDLRRYTKVTQSANRHVAADTGKTIEKEGAH
jgi:hypothetical protein